MSEFEMFIMRGASGSGKSSKARTLDGMVLSTDDFFIDAATGEYRFNVAILAQAHCWNVARAEAAIAAKVQRIIVDNTNLEAWEAGPYVRLAQGSRYTVKIIDADSPWCRDPVELLRRQTHGVPLETLKAQLARLESYSVAQAARTPSKPSQLSPHEQKKLKASAQRSVEALIKSSNGDDSGDNDNENDGVDETTVAAPSSSSVRVEIAVNDGAKSRRKPFVIRSADFDAFLQAALASLKLKGNAPLCFDDSGRRVAAIADIVPNSLLVFSARGEPFVAALNKQRKGGVVADESSTASPAAAAASTHASAHEKAGAPWKFCKHGIHKLPLGASTIVDNFLFLGSARDAHSGQHMHELDIKHVLNVAREVPQTSVPLDAYAATPLDDDDAQSIAAALPVALRFLDSARTAKARVLVHCVIGKSRSTTIVLAFLVARCDMSLLDAWRMVRAARPVVQPNANFLRQLMRLELEVRGARTLTWPLFHADVLPHDARVDVLGWLRTFGESAPVGSERAALATHAWVDALTVERFVIAPIRVEELLSLCAMALKRSEPMLVHQLIASSGTRPHVLVERRSDVPPLPAGALAAVLARDSQLMLIGDGTVALPASLDDANELTLPLDVARLVAPSLSAPFDALVAMSLYDCPLPEPFFAAAMQPTATVVTALVRGPAIVGELAVVEFVRKFGVQRAVDQFSLKARYHERHRNLVSLSYSEAASDFSSPVVRQCRGIVLDTKHYFRPVCLPFDKFFNLGDDRADKLDWSSVVLAEKLDGSFAKMYHYEGEWHVASMSVPDGNGNVNNSATFAQIFWEVFRTCKYTEPAATALAPDVDDVTELTLMFEMLTPLLPIVIAPQSERLVLIGVRHRVTGAEYDPVGVAQRLGFQCAPQFPPVASAEEALAAVRRLNASEHEGFVARDGQFRRVKIKAPGYVAAALLRGASSDTNSVTIKAALGVVRIGETSEFLAVFPQHRALFAFVQARFEAIRAALLRELKQQHAAEDGDDDDDDDDEDEGDDDDDDGDETTSSALAWQPRIGPVRKLASQFSGDVNTANVAQFLMNCDTELLQKAIGRQTEMAAAKSWATPRRKQHGQQRRGKGGRRK